MTGRLVRIVATVLATSASWVMAIGNPAATPGLALGHQIFDGDRTPPGRLTGHTQDLPQSAVRCSNCHRLHREPGLDGRSDGRSYGPVLDTTSLTQSHARRGGPPSRYDERSLCKLLRDGVDPAWVVIDRTMPRYQMTDTDCRALWHFLTAEAEAS